MWNAVWTPISVQWLLDNTTTKGIPIIAPFIRDYPELAYLWFDNPNRFDNGGKWQKQLTHAQKRSIPFKKIWMLESDMSVEKNAVTWYEVWAYTECSEVVTAATASNTIEISPDDLKYFTIWDIIVIRPAAWSAWVAAQVEITNIDIANNKLTVDVPVTVVPGDLVVFGYNVVEECQKPTKCSQDDMMTPMKVYFQRYGGCVDFKLCDINTKRQFLDAKSIVSSKFATVTNRNNSEFAKSFFLWRNIPGTKSETQGLDCVIADREAANPGSSLYDFSTMGLTSAESRLLRLQKCISIANTAPVYTGSQGPTIFVNHEMINRLQEDLMQFRKGLGWFDLTDNKMCFGMPSFCSPYFKSATFIVSHTLNKLEPSRAVAYMFPGHLVWFKSPEYASVDSNGVLQKHNPNGYTIMKQPQTSPECVEYTMLMIIANIFGWQTFANTYKKITNY